MKPIYAEKIIVGIICDKTFDWYILDKDLCYLDSKKLARKYYEKGYIVPEDPEFRGGIKVLSEHTRHSFLKYINEFKIKTSELKRQLKYEINDRYAYNYSVLIDFDKCRLFSYYAEDDMYEEYVPDNWTSEYKDFSDYINPEYRYWIGDNNENLILME